MTRRPELGDDPTRVVIGAVLQDARWLDELRRRDVQPGDHEDWRARAVHQWAVDRADAGNSGGLLELGRAVVDARVALEERRVADRLAGIRSTSHALATDPAAERRQDLARIDPLWAVECWTAWSDVDQVLGADLGNTLDRVVGLAKRERTREVLHQGLLAVECGDPLRAVDVLRQALADLERRLEPPRDGTASAVPMRHPVAIYGLEKHLVSLTVV